MQTLSRLLRPAALAAGLALGAAALAGPSVFPTGTTRLDPERAWNGFVLFTGGDNIARLIDLNGRTVHEWKDAAAFSTAIDPAVNGGRRGHVLVTLELGEGAGTDLIPGRVNNRISKTVGELDWSGKPVWTFGEKAPGGFARQHHDWGRLPNGNTFIDERQSGRLFQVTRKGDIVWECVNAHPRAGKDERGRPTLNFQLYRAQPVPADWVPAELPKAVALRPELR